MSIKQQHAKRFYRCLHMGKMMANNGGAWVRWVDYKKETDNLKALIAALKIQLKAVSK